MFEKQRSEAIARSFEDSTLEAVARNQADWPYRLVFVGGAARSGTTFLNALISTSAKTNPFIPEFHYLFFLSTALAQALAAFKASQHTFFTSERELIEPHMAFMREVVDRAWSALGSPPVLVIKQPNLTPMFGMMAPHFPNAQFVVLMRDARDVIASLQRGDNRLAGVNAPMPQDILNIYIDRYNAFYRALLGRADADLSGRILPLIYERFVTEGIDVLGRFLDLPDIDASKLWESDLFDIGDYREFHLNSDLWGKPMSESSIGSFAGTISDEVAEFVRQNTWETTMAYNAWSERVCAELATQ